MRACVHLASFGSMPHPAEYLIPDALVEITPQMIEVGIDVVASYRNGLDVAEGYDTAEDFVMELYATMRAVQIAIASAVTQDAETGANHH